jgi:riboflavin kinase/FMN adenylyltransferase
MRTVTSLDAMADRARPIVFAAGAFDGVHRGHQAVLAEARRRAAALGGEAWALTFDPHPLKVLRPERAPALITSTPHRLRLLARTGVDGVALLPFDAGLSEQEPEEFIARICGIVPNLRAMVVGENWTFGRRARGNTALLRALAARHGFDVAIVAGIEWGGLPISSTRIRQAVTSGDLAAAQAMLGRPFSMYGTVVHGAKLGRALGYPTANVDPHNEVRPPAGIYACWTRVEETSYPSAAFLAARPDPRKGPPDVVEVHLIDATLDLYDRDIDVCFVRKLREEERYDSIDALKAQIARDIEVTRVVLQATPPV